MPDPAVALLSEGPVQGSGKSQEDSEGNDEMWPQGREGAGSREVA